LEILDFQGALQLADRPGHPHLIVVKLNALDPRSKVSTFSGVTAARPPVN